MNATHILDKSLAEWMSRYIRWSDEKVLGYDNTSEEANLLGLAITLIRNEPKRLEPIGELIDSEWKRRQKHYAARASS